MSDFDSIRVQHPGKRVNVNDSGEYITLDLYDVGFLGRTLGLIKQFEDSAKSLSAQAEAASRESVDEIRELARKSDEECGALAVKIDEVFGDGASRKIFGEKTPGFYELADFFGQIGEFIKKYGDERVEKYKEKYSKYDRKAE